MTLVPLFPPGERARDVGADVVVQHLSCPTWSPQYRRRNPRYPEMMLRKSLLAPPIVVAAALEATETPVAAVGDDGRAVGRQADEVAGNQCAAGAAAGDVDATAAAARDDIAFVGVVAAVTVGANERAGRSALDDDTVFTVAQGGRPSRKANQIALGVAEVVPLPTSTPRQLPAMTLPALIALPPKTLPLLAPQNEAPPSVLPSATRPETSVPMKLP